MGAIFDACVYLLVLLADGLGITYKAVNVWIFVILWPILTVALVAVVVSQQIRIRRLLELVRARESRGG